MGENRITGDISTDPLAAKSRTVSADEVKLFVVFFYILFKKVDHNGRESKTFALKVELNIFVPCTFVAMFTH